MTDIVDDSFFNIRRRTSSEVFGDNDACPSPTLNPQPDAELQIEQIVYINSIQITHPDYFTLQEYQKLEKPRYEDFEWGEILGEGAYGVVKRAVAKATRQEFAIKILDKTNIIKKDKVKNVRTERDILAKLDHPNIVKLYHTFQDDKKFYFVMELASRGGLFQQVQKFGPADYACAQFYVGEIVLALEYLHLQGILHRDLKPENMLVAWNGHIKISDFGSAALAKEPNLTFVGTAQYMSPEVLKREKATRSTDLWALGCVIYQLLAGHPPFEGEHPYTIFSKIQQLKYEFPPNFPEAAKDLVSKLLVLDPLQRLGSEGNFDVIKQHRFFSGIDFATLPYQVPPAFSVERENRSMSQEHETSFYCAFETFDGLVLDNFRIQSLKQSQSSSLFSGTQFLLRDEAIIMSGLIYKRVGLFARPRQFILTSFPRLFYIRGKEMKGEIPWTQINKLEKRDSSTLYIHTLTRVYHLENVDQIDRWIAAIIYLQKSAFTN